MPSLSLEAWSTSSSVVWVLVENERRRDVLFTQREVRKSVLRRFKFQIHAACLCLAPKMTAERSCAFSGNGPFTTGSLCFVALRTSSLASEFESISEIATNRSSNPPALDRRQLPLPEKKPWKQFCVCVMMTVNSSDTEGHSFREEDHFPLASTTARGQSRLRFLHFPDISLFIRADKYQLSFSQVRVNTK